MRGTPLLPLVLCLAACRAESHGNVSLVLGEPDAEPRTFEVRSAFAEYLVLPELRNELRITLASYESSCEKYAPPGSDDAALIVTVATPAKAPPIPGVYDWAGHPAHGGTPERPERAYAVPVARLGARGYEFQPGGGLELKELGIAEGDQVRGLLNFEFPGDGTRRAQGIKGSFSARVCRTNGAPTPG
jgi:hypothetical protein